jgi:hypothetical protein
VHTTWSTVSTSDISLGSLTLPAPKAGDFTELILLYIFVFTALDVLLTAEVVRCVSELYFVVISGICITTDLDTLLYHMNNARYLRELDFARVDFYARTGFYARIRDKGGAVVQGACTIRYRRFVRPFTIFKITSKVNDKRRADIALALLQGSLIENLLKNKQVTRRPCDVPPYYFRCYTHENGNHRNQEN